MKLKARTKKVWFREGGIPAAVIADSISGHSAKRGIGAHSIFLGQVRADKVDEKQVTAITYSAYGEMAEEILTAIREEIIVRYQLTCAHVLHSIGTVHTGEICLFVFTSAPHRESAMRACEELVERIKKEVPVFGKEQFQNGSFQWKNNRP